MFSHLSTGQTIATSQRNISQHCWSQHVACVWPTCCNMLQHVGCSWPKFENGQIFQNNIRGCRVMLYSFGQVHEKMLPNILPQHVATGWPNNACNMLKVKCCDCLARACKCLANNVCICSTEILRSFGQSFKVGTHEGTSDCLAGACKCWANNVSGECLWYALLKYCYRLARALRSAHTLQLVPATSCRDKSHRVITGHFCFQI